MSRSYKKTPIIGITTSESEKGDKKIWHSRFRTTAKQKINTCNDYDNLIDVHFREVSNIWSMAKDGRKWLNIAKKPYFTKYMRK